MKYSALLTKIADYHAHKGIFRRLFGDSKFIIEVTRFMKQESLRHGNNATLPDLDLKYSDFQEFTKDNLAWRVNPFRLLSTRLSRSKRLLKNWYDQDSRQGFQRNLQNFTVPPVQSNLQPFNFIVPSLSPSPQVQPLFNPQDSSSSLFSPPMSELTAISRSISFFDGHHNNYDALLSRLRISVTHTRSFPNSSARFFASEEGIIHDDSVPLPRATPAPPPSPVLNTGRTLFNFRRQLIPQALPEMPAPTNHHAAPAA